MKIILISLIIQFIIFTQTFAFFGFSQSESSPKPIAVIINSELYPQVKNSIDRYLDDLKNEGHEVFFSEWDYNAHPDVEELKTLLQNYHQNQNLQGAVLIGKIPYAQGNIQTVSSEGPIETYLMDLNNAHFIKNAFGKIKTATRNLHLDIWVSRIWAPKDGILFSGMSEADLLQKYFEKNHLYRTCSSPVLDYKIRFEANDDMFNKYAKGSEYLNSWINFYQYLSESGYPQEYLKFVRENPAQYLYLVSHSESNYHTFTFSGKEVRLGSKDIIAKAHIQQPFLLLDACSACKFSDSRSLGNAYLFDVKSKALVIGGLTVPGNALYSHFISSNGNIFGNNFINAVNNKEFIIVSATKWMAEKFVTSNMVDDLFKKAAEQLEEVLYNLSIGLTLLGDPTLKAYIDMDWCPEYDSQK